MMMTMVVMITSSKGTRRLGGGAAPVGYVPLNGRIFVISLRIMKGTMMMPKQQKPRVVVAHSSRDAAQVG